MSAETLTNKPSVDITIEIARLNPHIRQITFARYSPDESDEPDLFWYFSREQVLKEEEIRKLASAELVFNRTLIGFCSLVDIAKEPKQSYNTDLQRWAQIPMLFFKTNKTHAKDTKTHIEEIKQLLSQAGQEHGWIASAPFHGNPAYYYCSNQILSIEAWQDFMRNVRNIESKSVYVPSKYTGLALIPKITRQTHLDVQAMGFIKPYAIMRISTNSLIEEAPKIIDAF